MNYWGCIQIFLVLQCGLAWAQYSPPDHYLIACGQATDVTVGNRVFSADNPTSLATGGVVGSTAQNNAYLSYPSLLTSARFFPANASYNFNISSGGRHWVRLYFYPFASSTFSPNNSRFSVLANGFTLMDNFSSVAFTTPTRPDLMREYLVNTTSKTLVLTFVPEAQSYAFVNAIEVQSLPDNLVQDDGLLLGSGAPVTLGLASAALQSMYRLNVGGTTILPLNDSQGIDRTWKPDDEYIFSAATGQTSSVDPSKLQNGTQPRYSVIQNLEVCRFSPFGGMHIFLNVFSTLPLETSRCQLISFIWFST